MKKNKFLKPFGFLLALLLAVSLAACSKQKAQPRKPQLPSAKTVLIKAENTKFDNMHCTWLQTNASGRTLQKAEVKYNHHPLVVFANFTTNANHYKMWIRGKNNYVQMQGTATKRWFKTKLSKTSSYVQLTGDLAEAAIISFTKNAKLFKVSQGANKGYVLSYNGKSKKMWKDVNQGSMISSIIGIDTDNAKPRSIKVLFKTDRHYHLTNVQIDAAYRDENSLKHLKMNINEINQLGTLKVPKEVTSTAVDIGR